VHVSRQTTTTALLVALILGHLGACGGGEGPDPAGEGARGAAAVGGDQVGQPGADPELQVRRIDCSAVDPATDAVFPEGGFSLHAALTSSLASCEYAPRDASYVLTVSQLRVWFLEVRETLPLYAMYDEEALTVSDAVDALHVSRPASGALEVSESITARVALPDSHGVSELWLVFADRPDDVVAELQTADGRILRASCTISASCTGSGTAAKDVPTKQVAAN